MSLYCLSGVLRSVRPRMPHSRPASVVSVATLVSKSVRGAPKQPKVKPWPYRERGFGRFGQLLDSTRHRMDEHSKLLVVEGPMYAGREAMARQLADEFDMIYVPPPTPQMIHANEHGFDLRQLNPKLSHNTQFLDYTDFLRNPNDDRVAKICYQQYVYKFRQTVGAMAHLLNTGQGVVINQSIFSEYVNWEAMRKMGYLSREDYDYFQYLREESVGIFMRPHLVVFMDLPVEEVMLRIKAHNSALEVNSPALNERYIAALLDAYKNDWLRSLSSHSEVFLVDGLDDVAVECVVEDLQKLDLDVKDEYRLKFEDWVSKSDDRLGDNRASYTNSSLLEYVHRQTYRVDSMNPQMTEMVQLEQVLQEALGQQRVNYSDTVVNDVVNVAW